MILGKRIENTFSVNTRKILCYSIVFDVDYSVIVRTCIKIESIINGNVYNLIKK